MVALGFKKNRVPVHVCNRERLCGSVVGRTFTPRSFFHSSRHHRNHWQVLVLMLVWTPSPFFCYWWWCFIFPKQHVMLPWRSCIEQISGGCRNVQGKSINVWWRLNRVLQSQTRNISFEFRLKKLNQASSFRFTFPLSPVGERTWWHYIIIVIYFFVQG